MRYPAGLVILLFTFVFIPTFVLTIFLLTLSFKPEYLQTQVNAVNGVADTYSILPTKPLFNPELLKNAIENVQLKTKADVSIVVKNLKTGEEFKSNEHKIYETASLYKLWIMAATFSELENGTIEKDTIISANIEDLNQAFNISTESAEKKEGAVQYSVENALEQMLTVSDNYSALLLSNKIRLSKVNDFLKKYNFTDSKLGSTETLPTSTASDIAIFLEKLYKGELISKESSVEMIEILKRQQIKRKLPKYLPLNTEIAHKTGELDTFTHDAGIIYTSHGDYLIVMMTESNNRALTEEYISRVSEIVFNYFTLQEAN